MDSSARHSFPGCIAAQSINIVINHNRFSKLYHEIEKSRHAFFYIELLLLFGYDIYFHFLKNKVQIFIQFILGVFNAFLSKCYVYMYQQHKNTV